MVTRNLAALLFLIFAGCSEGLPAYGNAKAIAGWAGFAEEATTIELCEGDREKCHFSSIDQAGICWLELSQNAGEKADSMDKTFPTLGKSSVYWIEGRGRIAQGSASYGHSGTYRCRVEVTDVYRFSAKR